MDKPAPEHIPASPVERRIAATRGSDLPSSARWLYACLALRLGGAVGRAAEVSNAQLGADSGLSERTIQGQLAELARRGWIEIEPRRGRPNLVRLTGLGMATPHPDPEPSPAESAPPQILRVVDNSKPVLSIVEPGQTPEQPAPPQNLRPKDLELGGTSVDVPTYSDVVRFLVSEVGPVRGEQLTLPDGEFRAVLRRAVAQDASAVLDALRCVAWSQQPEAVACRDYPDRISLELIIGYKQQYAEIWRKYGRRPPQRH